MEDKKTISAVFKNGLWRENPILILVLGACPTLAVSNSVVNALAMGLASTFVLISANTMVSMARNLIPAGVRIPCYILIIAAFVTLADVFLKAYFPPISKALGPYVPLIVVNCMILARAEVFASKNAVTPSIADAIGSGLGFTWVLLTLGAIREILGSGAIFGFTVLTEAVFTPWVVMLLPAGAFLTYGLFMGLTRYITQRR
jgi:electron transport complex protein RnfE